QAAPACLQLVEAQQQGLEKRHVVRAQHRIVEAVADAVPCRTHSLQVATGAPIRQARLGAERLRAAVKNAEPLGSIDTMLVKPAGILLAPYFVEEEPRDLSGRVLDASVVASRRQGQVREEPLIHGALDQGAFAR